MKRLAFGLASGVVALLGPANAAVIDFVAEAAGNERGLADGTTINFDGLDVTFSSEDGYYAYLDDLSAGKPGGLGACEALIGGSGTVCSDTADDNIRADASVTLNLGITSTLSDFSFTDMDHNDLNTNDTNTLLIAINDPDAFVQYTFAEAVALVIAGVDLIRFAFDESGTGAQFYVNRFDAAPIPLPAAAPLLLGGLAAIGLASRMKRKGA